MSEMNYSNPDSHPGVLGWRKRYLESSNDSIYDAERESEYEGFRELFDPDWDGKTLRFHDYWTEEFQNLKFPGFDNHNKSIDLLNLVWQEAGAWIFPGHDSSHKNNSLTYEIHFEGKQSGTSYKVVITFNSRAAGLFASRFDEIQDANQSSHDNSVMQGFLYAFREMMRFRVLWFDPIADSWEYICIDPEDVKHAWPGDHIVAIIYSLRDDLNSALNPSMDTLRRVVTSSSRLSWAEGRSNISIYRLHCYLSAYEQIDNYHRSNGWDDEKSNELSRKLFRLLSDPGFPSSKTLQIVGNPIDPVPSNEAIFLEGIQ